MRRRFCVAPPSFRLGLHCSARRFHAQIRRTGSEWARAFYCIRAVVFFCVDFGLFELCRLRIASPVLRRSPKLRLGLHCSARRFHAQMRRTGAEWARAFYCKRAVVSFGVDFGLFELCRLRIMTPVLRRSPKLRFGRHCSARRFHAQMRRTGAEWARAFYCKRAVVSFGADFGLFELWRLRIASPVLRRSPKLSLGAPLQRTTISRPNASHGRGMGAGVLL